MIEDEGSFRRRRVVLIVAAVVDRYPDSRPSMIDLCSNAPAPPWVRFCQKLLLSAHESDRSQFVFSWTTSGTDIANGFWHAFQIGNCRRDPRRQARFSGVISHERTSGSHGCTSPDSVFRQIHAACGIEAHRTVVKIAVRPDVFIFLRASTVVKLETRAFAGCP
jgi:hypothetical protein